MLPPEGQPPPSPLVPAGTGALHAPTGLSLAAMLAPLHAVAVQEAQALAAGAILQLQAQPDLPVVLPVQLAELPAAGGGAAEDEEDGAGSDAEEAEEREAERQAAAGGERESPSGGGGYSRGRRSRACVTARVGGMGAGAQEGDGARRVLLQGSPCA